MASRACGAELGQHLLELVRVGHDRVEASAPASRRSGSVAHQPPQRREAAVHQVVEIQHPGREDLAAAHGEELPGQRRGPVGGALDLPQILTAERREPASSCSSDTWPRMPVSRLLKSWAMPPASWPMAWTRFGPDQPLLQLAPVGHVGAASDHAAELAAGREVGDGNVEQPAVLAVVPPHPVLQPERLPAGHGAGGTARGTGPGLRDGSGRSSHAPARRRGCGR